MIEASPQRKREFLKWRKLVGATVGALALTVALSAGDKPLTVDPVWVGADSLRDGLPAHGGGRSVVITNRNQVRVATYNMKGGHIDAAGAVRTARSLRANVLGLTEAGTLSSEISGGEYKIAYGGAGNVLLSTYPILEHFSENLPRENDKAPRTALFAQLDMGQYNQWFVVTHLAHSKWPESSDSMRLQEVEAMQATIDARLDAPPIVLGDFNFLPGGAAYDQMDANYDDALDQLGIGEIGTFRGFMAIKRFDYIFIDEDLQYDVVAGGRFESEASDHVPIMAIIEPSHNT